jgi:hypothetical protein
MLALSLFVLSSAAIPAHADEVRLGRPTSLMRPVAPNPAWVDTDPIEVPGRMCGVSKVRVQVTQRDVRLNTVRIVFGNGSMEILNFGGTRFNAPSTTPWIDVPGYERCVDRLVISGYTAPKDNPPGEGVVQVLGLVQDARPPVVVVPVPRPAPVYETRTRRELDLNSKELIANPEIMSGLNQDYTVNLYNPESVGAIQLEAKYDDAFIDEVVVTFANGMAQKIELGSFTSDGWIIRDGSIYLSRNQRSGILDLMGYGERRVTSITIRGREGGAGEAGNSGIKPVIEVYGVGTRIVSEQVCVANCN